MQISLLYHKHLDVIFFEAKPCAPQCPPGSPSPLCHGLSQSPIAEYASPLREASQKVNILSRILQPLTKPICTDWISSSRKALSHRFIALARILYVVPCKLMPLISLSLDHVKHTLGHIRLGMYLLSIMPDLIYIT